MKTLLITIGLMLAWVTPAAALHQAGPNINCVAVIYDDFSVQIESWADVSHLDRGLMIKMVIFHDTGASGGPGQTGFVGFNSYAVFLQGHHLLARAVSPSGGNSGVAKERLFRPNGTQTGTVTLPPGMASSAAVGANAFFTSIPTSSPGYAANTDIANGIDIIAEVGLCIPAV